MKKSEKGVQNMKQMKKDQKYGSIQLHTQKFDILQKIGQDKKAEKFVENLFFRTEEIPAEIQ